MPGPVSLTLRNWPPIARPSDGQRDGAAGGGELDRVRQEVEADLAHGALVGPRAAAGRLELLDDPQALVLGAEPHQPLAVLGDVGERDRRLVQLVAAGLDAGDIENLVDEIEQVLAALMDVVGVFLVGRVAHAAPGSPSA